MPQQLIFTSSPRGLVIGRSGYCAVAATEGLREALQSRLEQFSYYEHVTSAGAQQPVIYAYRLVDIRGSHYHVLSRIADAGLDFTKRTNFIAHHLVFTPAETAKLPFPPVIFQLWDGWRNAWAGEPEWLRNEQWGNLSTLASPDLTPCRNWQMLTGDAVNAAALLDIRPESFLADGLDANRTLMLFAEALALQAARPDASDAWQQPFTTYLQDGDDPENFRWRLVYSGSPAYARLIARGAAARPLSTLRPERVDALTAAYARSGPKPIQITTQPQDVKLVEGQTLLLRVCVRGLPPPKCYQWYQKRVQAVWQELPGQNQDTLQIATYSDPGQISRFKVVIWDAWGKPIESQEAKVLVERDEEQSATPLPSRPKPNYIRVDATVQARARQLESSDWGVDERLRGDAPPQKSHWILWMGGGILAVLALLACLLVPMIKKSLIVAGMISTPTNKTSTIASSITTADGGANLSHLEFSSDEKQVSVDSLGKKPPRTYLLLVASPSDPAAKTSLQESIEKNKQEVQEKQKAIKGLPEKLNSSVTQANDEIKRLSKARDELLSEKWTQQGQDKLNAIVKALSRASLKYAAAKEAATPGQHVAQLHKLHRDLDALQAKQRRLSDDLDNQKNYEYYHTQLKASQVASVGPQLTNLCFASTNQPAYCNVTSYGAETTAGPRNCPVKLWDTTLKHLPMQFTISWPQQVTDGGYLAIDDWDQTNKTKLSAPFVLSFMQQTNAGQAEAQVLLWPTYHPQTNQATADWNGLIQTGNSKHTQGLMVALAALSQASFRVEMRISYLEECSASFPFTNTTFAFTALAEMMKTNASNLAGMEKWESAINKLTQFQQQLTNQTNQNRYEYKSLRTNIWADLAQMCQVVVRVNGRSEASAQGYLFDQDPLDTAKFVISHLDDGKSPDDSIVTSLRAVLEGENIKLLQQMANSPEISNGKDGAAGLTILQIKDKVDNLLARCRLDPARLKGTICYKFKWEGPPSEVKEVELVRFRFVAAPNTNSRRP